MYKIEFSSIAERQFFKLDYNVQDRILNTLKRIQLRPHAFIKRLTGSSFYRLRVGDYRLILDVKQDILIVLVIEIGHRRNIYK